MRQALRPNLHLFVCANRREGSPLGPGCGERGDVLYDALKREVAVTRRFTDTWVTKTQCLGICPKHGVTVARYPSAQPILQDVTPADIPALLAKEHDTETENDEAPATWELVESEMSALEDLQTKKVLDLARRLKPGLTLEDVSNPHDFPELNDPDWHFADGILAGIKSVVMSLRALRNRKEDEK